MNYNLFLKLTTLGLDPNIINLRKKQQVSRLLGRMLSDYRKGGFPIVGKEASQLQ
jgi:hypothetical protein